MTAERARATMRYVTGRVTGRDGSGVAGVTVTAVATRLWSQVPLGEAVTDAAGVYRIEFTAADMPDTGAGLLVRASAEGHDAERVVPGSGTDTPAGSGLDLHLPGYGPSEYARMLATVTPLLDGTDPADLVEDDTRHDIGRLALLAGLSLDRVGRLASAAGLARATGLPAEPFYGLLAHNLPAELTALAQRSSEEMRSVFAAAAKAHVIAPVDSADDFVATLRARELAAARTPALAPDGVRPSPLAEIFTVAVPDPAVRERLYGDFLDGGANRAAFGAASGPRTAEGEPGETAAQAPPPGQGEPGEHTDRLRLALHLGALTDDNAPLVRTLLARFDTGEFTSRRDLVRLDGRWAELVAETGGVPQRIGDSAEVYAQTIHARVTDAYPTAHIALRLANHPDHAEAPGTRFLAANPEFDLIATPVNPVTVPDDTARSELAAIQRTFKVARDFDTMQALRDHGFASAYDIASIAPDTFAQRVSGTVGEPVARAVHARATHVHAAAVNLMTDLRTAGQLDVPWLPQVGPLAQVPDWEDLFGSADYGAVAPSRSVTSQAAYLVDLLYYLRRLGGNVTTGPSRNGPVADVLYARRPDLWDVDLSTDNTELSLPCIDLVNELLESAVAPADAIPATERQSNGEAEELRVQPQHVNTGAYETLRTAVYPWDLPFDLWAEQTAVWLGHLGVTRETLLTTLGTGGMSSDTASNVLTAERLGLTTAARRIIAGEPLPPAHTLAAFYGRPADTADADLVREMSAVRTLLDTAGLRFTELAALLETRFVNPGGTLYVTPAPDAPDDTTKMTLTGLDTAALDRLHRFVRLHRALGGTAADLDRLIQAANNRGLLDATTLHCIAAARSLAARMNLPVERVVAFCLPLDTYRYPSDSQPPLYDRLFLDPTVMALPPGAPTPFELNADRTELKVLGTSLDTPAVSAALLAVLEVTDEDLAQLVSGPDAAVPSRALNLAHLSILVCAVTLARFLDLSISDLLRLVRLDGNTPWIFQTCRTAVMASAERSASASLTLSPDSPLDLLEHAPRNGGPALSPTPAATTPPLFLNHMLTSVGMFLDHAQTLRATAFTVSETDVVLTATLTAQDGPVPDDTTLATTLSELRAALQTVAQQTTRTTDAKGELTRKDLALLGWDSPLVQDAVSTLLGTVAYQSLLATLPAGLTLPTDLPVRYEPGTPAADGRLVFTGPMNDEQRQRLIDLATAATPIGAAYRSAVEELYQAPRTFVKSRMKALRVPVFSAPLTALPPGYRIPAALAGKVFYDPTEHRLRSRGYLTDAAIRALKTPPADADLAKAVDGLAAAQEAAPEPANRFLTDADADALFGSSTVTPADRFHFVLERLLPYLRRTLSETTIVQQLGQATNLDPASTAALLGTWLRDTAEEPILQDFLAPQFVGSDPSVTITRIGFAPQLTSLALLHRVALVLTKLRLTAEELPFVFTSAAPATWLDLNALPRTPLPRTGASPLVRSLIALAELTRLRDAIPGRMATIDAIFTAGRTPNATSEDVARELSRRTGWDATDILDTARSLRIQAAPQYADAAQLRLLLGGVALARRMGVSAARATGWLKESLSADEAQTARLAAKALHSASDWTTAATPVQDALRDRQRAALVSYLRVRPPRDGATPLWSDTNGMQDYFLIDVEMSAVQQTTRIAQAIYSTQLFVQRCLLNLETHVAASGSALWEQWEWMKQYRLWEANQKVFLYPENYLQPELRADKSPFFGQLETDLTQKELTDDNAQSALLHYLDQLTDVARLQPSGVYVDYDESWPGDFSGERVHVLARSESAPRTHYYRTWVNRLYWTPWEKVDLDIDGDSLTLGVWDRQLYAFWPTFIPAAEQRNIASLPDGGTQHELKPAANYWRIQLNWSEYRNGRWTPKRVSDEMIDTNPKLPPPFLPYEDPSIPPFFNPAAKHPYMFVPDVDGYSFEPVIWAVNGDAFEVFWTEGDKTVFAVSTVWGRFRLSRRRGTVLAEPMQYSAVRDRIFPPSDPDGHTGRQGRYISSYFLPPDGQRSVNNAWVEDQSGGPYARTFKLRESPVLLRQTPLSLPFRQVVPYLVMSYQRTLAFFTDSERSYLVHFPSVNTSDRYQFTPFYHPYVELLKSQLGLFGIDALFSRQLQLHPESLTAVESFEQRYSPSPDVVTVPYPTDTFDFDNATPYAVYNWELFFHAPLLMAGRLSTNQRFAEAQTWFHRIFDPTDRSDEQPPRRYWRTKPFFEASADDYQKQRISEILRRLATGDPVEAAKVDAWLRSPFQPDIVARLRTTAYQKAVVMKYLDNLIAWGDQLFRQDTLESVNQATQLYILAAELLGRRPEQVPRQGPDAPAMSYRELTGQPTPVTAAVTATENLLPAPATASAAIAPGLGTRWLTYFGIPRNEKLLGYWDTVEDRLTKIRHGQNIEGVTRAAALFGAAIDPARLIRATSAGLNLATVLDDTHAPLPHYRFGPMAAKAKELASQVSAFGGALLAALEKRDAETLARLRSTHERRVLDAVLAVRTKQKEEASKAIEVFAKSKAIALDKHRYFSDKAKNRLNEKERKASDLVDDAKLLQRVSAGVSILGSTLQLLPELKVGFPTTMGASWGGQNIGGSALGLANALLTYMGVESAQAQQSNVLGGFDHRYDEWTFQLGQADKEIAQYTTQIEAARIRQTIAQKELDAHHQQIANAKAADDFLYAKYTNQELYDWMVGQLTTTHFQAYQLAYDIAKRTERAYRHELGLDDSDFVQFGYWDSLHKGLLAGERLTADLNRMDAAYYESNAREFELSKRVSLAQFDPKALLSLKETGRAYVSLPEALFDLDTPGHYLRRIKSVAITVPCVAGPYTGVNLTATLLHSSVRVESRLSDGAYARQPADTRFRDYTGSGESIVTSTGQDDAGLFETNLRDDRFLPFEGTGAISEWQLSLPTDFRQFDYETISDVVLHLRYTAREGGTNLAQTAVRELRAALNGWLHAGGGKALYRTFSARQDHPDQWSRFLAAAPGSAATITFTVAKSRFPYLFHDESIKLTSPELVVVLSDGLAPGTTTRYLRLYADHEPLSATLTGPDGAHGGSALPANPALGGQPTAGFDGVKGKVTGTGQNWAITVPAERIAALAPELLRDGRLNPDAFVDLLLVWQYSVEEVGAP
ncbi:Tc toxin subunit A-related protein [Streptomyces melanogenes]|uniref:Tc toxin subunit A-related protein n=1 Tax=Streptomyces melanogenes TaxID=67326 RepID=UPI00167CDB5A|nr:neuraminidase-like domain-containing protein [Streptomyces melanogenes]GGP94038.1 hypothetical protein GCM10010278_85030 [Streptomyces melanogenes]